MFFTPTLTLGFGFENMFLTFSTTYVLVGVLRRSRSPFQTRLYRLHPWSRTACIHAGVPRQGGGSYKLWIDSSDW